MKKSSSRLKTAPAPAPAPATTKTKTTTTITTIKEKNKRKNEKRTKKIHETLQLVRWRAIKRRYYAINKYPFTWLRTDKNFKTHMIFTLIKVEGAISYFGYIRNRSGPTRIIFNRPLILIFLAFAHLGSRYHRRRRRRWAARDGRRCSSYLNST